jgi:hypothetical protein
MGSLKIAIIFSAILETRQDINLSSGVIKRPVIKLRNKNAGMTNMFPNSFIDTFHELTIA